MLKDESRFHEKYVILLKKGQTILCRAEKTSKEEVETTKVELITVQPIIAVISKVGNHRL